MSATATKTSARTKPLPTPTRAPSGRSKLKVVEPVSLSKLAADVPSELDQDEGTRWLIDRLREEADPLATAYPALRSYLRIARRERVRSLEHEVIRQFTPGDGTKTSVSYVKELTLLQLRSYANAEVSIPGYGQLRCGSVTVAQWEARDDAFLAKEKGLASTRRWHRAVIRSLKARKCDSIDEALEKGDDDGDS